VAILIQSKTGAGRGREFDKFRRQRRMRRSDNINIGKDRSQFITSVLLPSNTDPTPSPFSPFEIPLRLGR